MSFGTVRRCSTPSGSGKTIRRPHDLLSVSRVLAVTLMGEHIHSGAAGPVTSPFLLRITSHQYSPLSVNLKHGGCAVSRLSRFCPDVPESLKALWLKLSRLSRLSRWFSAGLKPRFSICPVGCNASVVML